MGRKEFRPLNGLNPRGVHSGNGGKETFSLSPRQERIKLKESVRAWTEGGEGTYYESLGKKAVETGALKHP
ncbi:MAG: hypothetical protein ABH816_04105 [Candidatus Levyibacteriota bacterium]